MPIYDFKCDACQTVTERLVKSDVEFIECPNCSSKSTKQVSATGGFILNGDGWFRPSPKAPVE